MHQLVFFIPTIIIFSTYANYIQNEPWMPTPEEIERVLLVSPPRCWGRQMRIEQSIRILALGGSNTDVGLEWPYQHEPRLQDRKWSEFLNSTLKSSLPQMRTSVINKGAACLGPEYTIWEPYPFESEPGESWPNLIIMEFGINCLREGISCVRQHDQAMHSIYYRYEMQGLPLPNYLLLEYFTFRILYNMMEGVEDTMDNRLAILKEYDKSNLRMQTLPEFARFYRIPLLSLADALSPAALRHFIQSNVTDMWPPSHDGTHLNHIGSKFVVDEILFPFLMKHIKERKGESMDEPCAVYGEHKIDYFQPSFYGELQLFKTTKSWSSWRNAQSLKNIVKSGPFHKWHFLDLRGHVDGHKCFGSTIKSSKGVFHIEAPNTCRHDSPCMLRIHYIHSWNSSYVGGATCQLIRLQKGNRLTIGHPLVIRSEVYDGNPVKDTTPRELHMPNISHAGTYQIECSNADNKLSCVSTIRLISTARSAL